MMSHSAETERTIHYATVATAKTILEHEGISIPVEIGIIKQELEYVEYQS